MSIPCEFNPLGISRNKMPTDGLVFYAPLDTNTIAKKGTLTKSPYSTSDVATSTQNGLKCISFDGAVSYYDSAFDALEAASKGTTQSNLYTISFWVKTHVFQVHDNASIGLGTVLGCHGDGRILEVLHPASLDIYSYYYTIHTKRNTCDGVWRHIVITSNRNIKKVFINNQQAGSRNFWTSNLQKGIEIGANTLARTGGGGAVQFFTGYIKCVRVYNRQLSQAQITQLFNQFLPVDNWSINANDQTFNFYQKNEGFNISASGDVKILSYQIISGTLPSSITFNTSTGQFYGKGLTDDDHVYNLRVRIHGDRNITKDINVTVNTYKTARISITSKTFNFYTDGSQNHAFNYTSDQPVTFTALTSLPTGLTLVGNTFYSDGTTPAGTYSIQVKGTSQNNQTGVTATMTIVMNTNVISIDTSSLKFFVDKGITSKNIAYSTSKHSITPIYSYSGTLPTGITFDTSTGTFTSDATQTADTSGTVQVTIASSTGYSTTATANVDLIVNLIGVDPIIQDGLTFFMPCQTNALAQVGQTIPMLSGNTPVFTTFNTVPCMELDGTQQFHDHNTPQYIKQTTQKQYTMSFWFTTQHPQLCTGEPGMPVIGYDNPYFSQINRMYVSVNDKKMHFIQTGHWDNAFGTVLNGSWHHYLYVVDGGGVDVHLDGVRMLSNYRAYSFDNGRYLSFPGVTVGNQEHVYQARQLVGYITRIKIYNRVLSQAQITLLASQF